MYAFIYFYFANIEGSLLLPLFGSCLFLKEFEGNAKNSVAHNTHTHMQSNYERVASKNKLDDNLKVQPHVQHETSAPALSWPTLFSAAT